MEMISCCGIMCGECPVNVATERDDDSMRKYLAHEYSAFGDQEFYPKDMTCHGCLTVSADHNKFGKNCQIRKCCKEHHIRLCAECKEYPCGKVTEFVPEGTEQRDRLNEMHKACENLL